MASQPSAPDPYATAAAQNAQNQSASQYSSVASNANEVNPYGTVSYQAIEQVPVYTNGQITGYAPRYQRTTTLSPDQQKLLGLETQGKYNLGTTAVEQSQRVRDTLNKPLDPSSWTPWQTNLQASNIRQDQAPTDRASVEQAMMDSYNRSVAPTEKAQEAQLAARGLAPGGKGYGNYQMQRDDSRAEQTRQAYLASGNEARANQAAYNDASTQQYNMANSLASYYNNLHGAQMQQDIALRNQPINETSALMSGSQATIPQFQPFQGSPVSASNIGQYISDNYKAQSAAASQTNAGIFSLLGGVAKLGMGGLGA
jgi:hypothetical protein